MLWSKSYPGTQLSLLHETRGTDSQIFARLQCPETITAVGKDHRFAQAAYSLATDLSTSRVASKLPVVRCSLVAGCLSHIVGPRSLLQQQTHRKAPQGRTSTAARAASSIPEEPKSVQRKVSHILVKRDQEHLLDEIENRLAGVYCLSDCILMSLLTVSTASLHTADCLRFGLCEAWGIQVRQHMPCTHIAIV